MTLHYRLFSLVCTLSICLGGHAAAAGTNLSIPRFDPTPAGDRLFGTDSAQVDGHLALDARLTLDWAHDPLAFHSATDNHTLVAVVQNQLIANLGIALALWNRLQLSIDVPVAIVQGGPSPVLGSFAITSPSGVHIADIRAGARVRMLTASRGLFNLSLGAFVWLPLGSSSSSGGAFTSDGFVRGRIELLAGGERDRFFWESSVGADLRRAQTFLNVTQGSMLRVSAGAGVLLLARKQLQIGPEATLDLTPPTFTRYNTNLEVLGGIRYTFLNRIALGAAAGPGLTSGIGTPDVRVVATLGWGHEFCPPKRDPEPEPLVMAPPPPPPPPPASQPETQPAPASEPLPPSDRDSDGIFDTDDACPDQAGSPSPNPKQNGCPSGAIVADQIVALEPIRFKYGSDKILKKSDTILQTVLATITHLPEGTRIRVEGHTDNRGSAKLNRKLSLARAKSVVRWMAAHGIAAGRFDAKGFGPDRPLMGNDTSPGREINRRVEFYLVK